MEQLNKIPAAVQKMKPRDLRKIVALQMDAQLDHERALRARRQAAASRRALIATVSALIGGSK